MCINLPGFRRRTSTALYVQKVAVQNAFHVLQWLLTSSSSLGASLKGFCYERAGASCHFMVGGGIVSVPPLCAGNKREHFKWNGPISQRRAVTLGFFFNWTGTYHFYFLQWWWQARGINSLSSVYKRKQLPRAWSLTRSHLYCACSLGLPRAGNWILKIQIAEQLGMGFEGQHLAGTVWAGPQTYLALLFSTKAEDVHSPTAKAPSTALCLSRNSYLTTYMCVLGHMDPWDLQGCVLDRNCLTSFAALLPVGK